MSHRELEPPKARCARCLGALLLGLLLLVVASHRVVIIVQKVFEGAGMEYCCSIAGVPFNYLASFVLLCGFAAGLLFAVAVQARRWRIRRDFERKYGVKLPASDRGSPSSNSAASGPSLHGVESGDGD